MEEKISDILRGYSESLCPYRCQKRNLGKPTVMQQDILILNSVAFEAQAIDFLKNHPE